VCLKDCIAVAGVPQTLGTKIIEPWTPEGDATVVTWALEAGAEIVGTANCENLCQSTSSFSSAYGIVENPFAEGFSAGGSTSGPAALVAGGIVDIAIGADQGGSIRVPAALCGCKSPKCLSGTIIYGKTMAFSETKIKIDRRRSEAHPWPSPLLRYSQ
jgi:amidase